MKYDVMVVGSGIAGMESSIKLGDMGYKVLLVEKEASVGGRMILLSKVFPTLDCASCISGPKMSSTINHPNITTMAYSEVQGIHREADGSFNATIKNKARFIDWAACTGCKDCQDACTVAVPDPFNAEPRRRCTPPTSRSRRPCRRRRSSTARAPRRASTAARPASRPTATCP